MKVLLEELSAPKRNGGIESATIELQKHLEAVGVHVERRSTLARLSDSADSQISAVRPQLGLAGGEWNCIHFHGIWSPALARRMVEWKRQGVPCLVTPHGMLEPWALMHKRLKKLVAWHLYQKHILNMASALHATASKEALQFAKLGLRPSCAVVPWGIAVPATIEDCALSSASRTALFVGRIYPVKGLPLLAEAWARVRPVGWRMKIVGPDEAGHQAEVELLVKNLGLSNHFEFAGPLRGDEKRLAYTSAQLFILPSHTENFGIAIGEALAHGLPVITTKGTPWELLQTHRCGWWVEARVEPLADALREATQLQACDLKEMGTRGRKLISERYSWPHIALQMRSVYEWMVGMRERPTCICQKPVN